MFSQSIRRAIATVGLAALAAAASAGMAIAAGVSKEAPKAHRVVTPPNIARIASLIHQADGTVTPDGQRILDAAGGNAAAISAVEAMISGDGATQLLLVTNVKNVGASVHKSTARAKRTMRAHPTSSRRSAGSDHQSYACARGQRANMYYNTYATPNAHVDWSTFDGVTHVTTIGPSNACSVVNEPCSFYASITPSATRFVTDGTATAAGSIVVITYAWCG
jgi:hypothetical protein